jgi:hypothetical protein
VHLRPFIARAYLRNLVFVPEKIQKNIPSGPKPPDSSAVRGGQKTVRRGRRGSGLKTAVLASLLGCGMAMPERDGYSAQQASVPYPRAILYDGLPAEYLPLMDKLIGNRLAIKSMDKVVNGARF